MGENFARNPYFSSLKKAKEKFDKRLTVRYTKPMNITHIVVYSFFLSDSNFPDSTGSCCFPCSSLEKAYERVAKSIKEELLENNNADKYNEIVSLLNEGRYDDAMESFNSYMTGDNIAIYPVYPEDIDNGDISGNIP